MQWAMQFRPNRFKSWKRQKVKILLDIRPSTQMNTSHIQMNYERFFHFFCLSLSRVLRILVIIVTNALE